MKSLIAKRSIMIDHHKTSVSLEDGFWTSLKEIARERNQTLSHLVAAIDADRQHGDLSSAIRLFVLPPSARSGGGERAGRKPGASRRRRAGQATLVVETDPTSGSVRT